MITLTITILISLSASTTFGYFPSVGFVYAPLEWLKFYADYNFDQYAWNQRYDTTRRSRGQDNANTFSLGMDMDLIKDVLGFHIQYEFSQGLSQITTRITGPLTRIGRVARTLGSSCLPGSNIRYTKISFCKWDTTLINITVRIMGSTSCSSGWGILIIIPDSCVRST